MNLDKNYQTVSKLYFAFFSYILQTNFRLSILTNSNPSKNPKQVHKLFVWKTIQFVYFSFLFISVEEFGCHHVPNPPNSRFNKEALTATLF